MTTEGTPPTTRHAGWWRRPVALLAFLALACALGLGVAAMLGENVVLAYLVIASALLIVVLALNLLYAERQRHMLLKVIGIFDEQTTHIRHEYGNGAARMGLHSQRLRALTRGTLVAEAEAALAALEREREAMRASTDAILRLSRARLDSLRLFRADRSMRENDLSARVDEAIDMLEQDASTKEIAVTSSLARAPLLGDDGTLFIMALNLIENAIKYTPEGGEIRVSCGLGRSHVYLSVEDSGPGVPVDMRTRIFEAGQRLSETESERGSGFGLALVREIVGQHDGTIEVGVSGRGGAAFHICFPAWSETRKGKRTWRPLPLFRRVREGSTGISS